MSYTKGQHTKQTGAAPWLFQDRRRCLVWSRHGIQAVEWLRMAGVGWGRVRVGQGGAWAWPDEGTRPTMLRSFLAAGSSISVGPISARSSEGMKPLLSIKLEHRKKKGDISIQELMNNKKGVKGRKMEEKKKTPLQCSVSTYVNLPDCCYT